MFKASVYTSSWANQLPVNLREVPAEAHAVSLSLLLQGKINTMGVVLSVFTVDENVTYVQLSIASITWCITISWMLLAFLWKTDFFKSLPVVVFFSSFILFIDALFDYHQTSTISRFWIDVIFSKSQRKKEPVPSAQTAFGLTAYLCMATKWSGATPRSTIWWVVLVAWTRTLYST